jgi:thiol-disulfide isomerase/thioredoxin
MKYKLITALIGVLLLVTACGSATAQSAISSLSTAQATSTSIPSWFNYEFTDAATGRKFSINDYQGKVVLVETLAMWCTNCHAQQEQVIALHKLLGTRSDFVSIGIDIDTNEKLNDLKAYVASNGFDWTYSIASPGVAREIGQLYGAEFLNPPSTPMLIVDQQGTAHPLSFGIKSAKDLQKALAPYLNSGL